MPRSIDLHSLHFVQNLLEHIGIPTNLDNQSLVYEYKDRKEEEIKNLSKNQVELKDEIEQNQKHYEKLIDAAADEISNFVEKANIDKIS